MDREPPFPPLLRPSADGRGPGGQGPGRLLGCVLIGGRSTRMGRPKHLIVREGRTLLERTVEVLLGVVPEVVISGAGDLPEGLVGRHPRVLDVPGVRGPLAGILAAMGWAPDAAWLVTACDLPHLSADALRWLLSVSKGTDLLAVLPRLRGTAAPRLEPLLAYYGPAARSPLEAMARRGEFRVGALASLPGVACPSPPASLARAWWNANRPEDLVPESP